MSESANVRSLHAIREFRAALVRFEDEATRAVSTLQMEIQRVMGWLERDRPQYWRRQVQLGHQRLAEARAAYTRCRMRQVGDIKPDCYVEYKALLKAKRNLEMAHEKVKVVRGWIAKAQHEVDEFNTRSAQLTWALDGDIPHMLALLDNISTTLEKYAGLPDGNAPTVAPDEQSSPQPAPQARSQ